MTVHKSLFALLVAAACGDAEPAHLRALHESRVDFEESSAESGGSYTYTRSWESWTGEFGRTTITVEDGVVTARSYEAGVEPDGAPTTTWSEGPADLGSHPEGHRVATMLELYDECEGTVLVQDASENEIVFRVDERGILEECTFRPLDCADDCTDGILIDSLVFAGS